MGSVATLSAVNLLSQVRVLMRTVCYPHGENPRCETHVSFKGLSLDFRIDKPRLDLKCLALYLCYKGMWNGPHTTVSIRHSLEEFLIAVMKCWSQRTVWLMRRFRSLVCQRRAVLCPIQSTQC